MPWNKEMFTGRPGKFDIQGHGLKGCGRAFLLADCCLESDMPEDPNVPWPIGGHSSCRCGVVSPHLIRWRDRELWHRAHKREVQVSNACPACIGDRSAGGVAS